MQLNKEPSKILRIEISPICNYQCTFCCWHNEPLDEHSIQLLPPYYYEMIISALINSGANRAHLTGGEPLALPRKELCDIISAISNESRLNEFYITTNASLLDEDYCKSLYKAGLRKLHVSIGAENNKKYRQYANPGSKEINLDAILTKLKIAIENQISIRVDVPISSDGIHNYEQLMQLVERLEIIGVTDLSYFKLHKTAENKAIFSKLFNPDMIYNITQKFYQDSKWKLIEIDNKFFMSDGKIRCVLPAEIEPKTLNCVHRRAGCGDYCQGTYAAYLIFQNNNIYIRACHHQFKNKMNEFLIPRALFENKDISAITAIFKNAWQWAAG